MLGEKIILQESTTVARVLEAWPQTISFFIQHRMDCVGCPVASFCTLEETAQHYEMDLKGLLRELASLSQA
ncbi:MAG: DUF1858 domain-containing protein [Chloroflexi bacterium]|nr:DUF1858 domain-containing protein [Chloroflexota bacterium]